MKKFSLRRLTSLGVAMSLIATMSGCARKIEKEVLPLESNKTAIEDVLINKESNEKDFIYDESGLFSHPLSYYSFNYFPQVNRTDVDLMAILDAYGVSYEDFTNIFVRTIYAERGDLSYEEAYALTTVRLNRLLFRNGILGDNIMDINTKGHQFGAYEDGSYQQFAIEDLENYPAWQAIIDCLVNFAEDQTNRMHNCMGFRFNEIGGYSDYTFTEGGSRFDMPLPENEITYTDITINLGQGLN